VAVRPDGRQSVKVLDFGISKLAPGSGTDVDLTKTEVLLGSPRYMSPEQLKHPKSVDARTDVWSMGVVLYEMLAGCSPFAGPTLGETMANVLALEVPDIRAQRPDVPEALALAIARCLERDRDRRYASVAELARAFAPFGSARSDAAVQRITSLEGLPRAAGSFAAPAAIVASSSTLTCEGASAEPRAPTAARHRHWLMAAAMLAIGGAGAWWILSPSSRAAPRPNVMSDLGTTPSGEVETSSAAPPPPPASSALPTGSVDDRAAPLGTSRPRPVRPTPRKKNDLLGNSN
jgi:serine/threonine-protein kinase